MGAGLLAKAVCQATSMLTVPASSRAGSLPQMICGGPRTQTHLRLICGAELARDCGGSACINVECLTAFASKPAPTGFYVSSGHPLAPAQTLPSTPVRCGS
ncbi:hypothetical protein C0J56_20450 [Pseudomonas fluorescens]|nr:hypothetical protein C0J56_20450 [Pseudomonas fluorescens]